MEVGRIPMNLSVITGCTCTFETLVDIGPRNLAWIPKIMV